MRIALVHPRVLDGRAETDEHLGLAYLAASLREAGHSVAVVDATLQDLSDQEVTRSLLAFAPELVGVSISYQRWVREALNTIEHIRATLPDTHIVVGGQFPSFEYERLMAETLAIDSVVIGEGDRTLPRLAAALASGSALGLVRGIVFRDGERITRTAPQELVANLDELPVASRDHAQLAIDRNDRLGIVASRGCFARCSFCSARAIQDVSPGAAWRGRPAADDVDEMMQLHHEYGVTRFQFWDDQFVGPGRAGFERAWELCRILQQTEQSFEFGFDCRADTVCKAPTLFAALKEVGLTHVYMGLESGSSERLSDYRKGVTLEQNREAIATIRSLGVRVDFGFIMFDPDGTLDDVRHNIRALRHYGSNFRQVLGTTITPYAGTPLARRLASEGRLIEDGFRFECTFQDPKVERAHEIIRQVVRWGDKRVPLTVSTTVLRTLLRGLDSDSLNGDGRARLRRFISDYEVADECYLDILDALISLLEAEPSASAARVQQLLHPYQQFLEEFFDRGESIRVELVTRGLLDDEDAQRA